MSGFGSRVEIYHDGEWGTVCGVGFGDEEGEVICRQLGHSGLDRLIRNVNKHERGESTICFKNYMGGGVCFVLSLSPRANLKVRVLLSG